jgi:outer membrane protein OmpA-like peptidoglycan-associated protein
MKNVPAFGVLATLAFGLSLLVSSLPVTAGFEDVAGEDEVSVPAPAPAPAPAPTKQTQVQPKPAPAPVTAATPAPAKQTQAQPKPAPSPVPAPAPVQAKPTPAPAPAPAPAAPVVPDIKTLKFSRTISGFGYKKWSADLPAVQNNIRSAMTAILPLIQKIKDHPDGSKYKIRIVGHTDGDGPESPTGDKPGNLTISRDRAQNVLDYIVANYNLSRDMFEVVAKGSSELKNRSNPLAAENRRVVIVFAP